MSQSSKPGVTALDHLVLTVSDIPRTIRFYEDILGMQAQQFLATDGSTRWALNFGTQKINLHQAAAEFEPNSRTPTPGSADLCFLSNAAPETWRGHLKSQGVDVEAGPTLRAGAQGPILSLYVRDPDGNLIEISKLV